MGMARYTQKHQGTRQPCARCSHVKTAQRIFDNANWQLCTVKAPAHVTDQSLDTCMSGWINPDTMTNDYSSYVVVPSRQGHKLINSNGGFEEIIAWQIETYNKNGAVIVRPITNYGIRYESEIMQVMQPSMKLKKTRAEYAQ